MKQKTLIFPLRGIIAAFAHISFGQSISSHFTNTCRSAEAEDANLLISGNVSEWVCACMYFTADWSPVQVVSMQ